MAGIPYTLVLFVHNCLWVIRQRHPALLGAAVGFISWLLVLGIPPFSMAADTFFLLSMPCAILPCVDAGGGGGRYCAALSAQWTGSIASARPS